MAEYLCEADMSTGEYISRDLALRQLNATCLATDCDNYNGVRCRACAYADAMDFINAIPAADVQPVKRGRWITKAEEYYKAWQDSGRSWDDMPYFVTGLKFACSNCFEQFDVNAEGVEKWNGCPLCLARMDGEHNENN